MKIVFIHIHVSTIHELVLIFKLHHDKQILKQQRGYPVLRGTFPEGISSGEGDVTNLRGRSIFRISVEMIIPGLVIVHAAVTKHVDSPDSGSIKLSAAFG